MKKIVNLNVEPLKYPDGRHMEKMGKERFFSVELKSKVNLKNIAISNGGHENVLVESTIGQLQHATFSEGVVLEVVGDKGVLRINLTQKEIKQKPKEERRRENE